MRASFNNAARSRLYKCGMSWKRGVSGARPAQFTNSNAARIRLAMAMRRTATR
jgi:hypothetical protein